MKTCLRHMPYACEWLAFAGCASAACLALAPAWKSLLGIGLADPEQGQVLLAPVAAATLVLLRASQLASLPRTGRWIGLPMLLTAWLISSWGHARGLEVLFHAGAVLGLVGSTVAVWGTRISARAAAALAALFFLVPVPGTVRQAVGLPLQQMTAQSVAAVFDFAGIPVERTGNLLIVGGDGILVAEACNGLRMLFALLLVSYAVAMSLPLRWPRRTLMLLASPLIAVGLNVLRLVPVVLLIAYAPPAFSGLAHDVSGWLMLAGAVAVPLFLARLLKTPLVDARVPAIAHGSTEVNHRALAPALTIIVLGLLLWATGAGPSVPSSAGVGVKVQHDLAAVPYRIGSWIAQDSEPSSSVLGLLKPNAIVSRTYRGPDGESTVHLVVISCLDARSLVGHWPAVCYPAQGWTVDQAVPVRWTGTLAAGEGTEFHVSGGSRASSQRLRVRTFLIAPDGCITGDMRQFKRLAEDPELRHLGAGQVQLIFAGEMAEEQREAAANEFLAAVEPAIRALISAS